MEVMDLGIDLNSFYAAGLHGSLEDFSSETLHVHPSIRFSKSRTAWPSFRALTEHVLNTVIWLRLFRRKSRTGRR